MNIKSPMWSWSPSLLPTEWKWFATELVAFAPLWENSTTPTVWTKQNGWTRCTAIDPAPSWIVNTEGIGLSAENTTGGGYYVPIGGDETLDWSSPKWTLFTYGSNDNVSTANQTIVAVNDDTFTGQQYVNIGCELLVNDLKIRVQPYPNGGGFTITGSVSWDDGLPHSICFIERGTDRDLWVDGNLEINETTSKTYASGRTRNFSLTNRMTTSAEHEAAWTATLYWSAVWNRELSSYEIKQLENYPFGPFRQTRMLTEPVYPLRYGGWSR